MGYYENPPIINLNRGAERIAAGAASAANSIAEALIKRGDRKREEEKEQKLTIKKLQEEKNKVDLYYNDYMSNFSKDQPAGNPIAEQTKAMLQQKIQSAADARIALTMESDSNKRSQYLKVISDAESFMDIAGKFGKNAAGEVLTYKQTPGIAMNTPGGWAVNADDKNLGKVTNTLNVLSGLTQEYESHNIELIDKGGTFAVKVSGKKKNGESFENIINANDYLNSDGSGTGGFLQKVENVDEFRTQSKKNIVNEKGVILETFLGPKTETVKIESEGESYQIRGARRLNEERIRKEIKSQAEIKAAGYIRANDQASLRALINSTLGKGPSYYDNNFKGIIDPAEQTRQLSILLEENAFQSFVGNYKTTKENGKTIYWGGEGEPMVIPKGKATGGGSGLGSGDGLTANKRLELKELEANATKQRKKLSDVRDTKPVYSADNKVRIIWSNQDKGWVRQAKGTGGTYEDDLDSPPIRSKNKAAAEFLGYGLP
jgi:hypothetical protein